MYAENIQLHRYVHSFGRNGAKEGVRQRLRFSVLLRSTFSCALLSSAFIIAEVNRSDNRSV